MRNLFYLIVLIVVLGLIISGCIFHVVPPLGQDGSIDIVKDDVSYKTNLIAGQHTVAGFITVSNDDENLFIAYETVDNWLINETHLYVGTTIPTNSAPGKFPYKHEELGGVTTDTYEIPLEDLGVGPCDVVYIATHAELVKGETEKGGWAEGVEIRPGKDWAMYFEYQVFCDNDSEYEKMAQTTDGAIDEFITNSNLYGEEQAKQMIIDSLMEKEEVIDTGIGIDNESIWFQWENGIIFSFSEYPEQDEQQKSLSQSFDDRGNVIDSKDTRNTPENNKAIIFDWEDSIFTTLYAKGIQLLLEAREYDVNFCTKSEFTLYELENINDYGVVYISSHGMGDKYGIKILTGQEASAETGEVWTYFKTKYGEDKYNTMIGVHTFYSEVDGEEVVDGRYFCFYPEFILGIALYENFPKSLVYADTCYSLPNENTSMADAFIDRGAYVYCGYDAVTRAGCVTDEYVFSLLLLGMNLENAIFVANNLPDIPFVCSGLDFYPEDKGDFYLVGIEAPETIAPPVTLINIYRQTDQSDVSKSKDVFNRRQGDNKTAVKYIDDNTTLIRGDSIGYFMGPQWEAYPEAEGYRIYRKINDSNYELMMDWDVSGPEYDDNIWFGVYGEVLYPEIYGNTFSYYIVAYNNSENWETVAGIPLEKTIDDETFLPPIYLNQPQLYSEVNDPNFLFQWTPVGDILPYGDIIQGNTRINVYGDNINYWPDPFNDFTTSQAPYNGDALFSGNTYYWRVFSLGFDSEGERIAESVSQEWEFTYLESPTPLEKPEMVIRTTSYLNDYFVTLAIDSYQGNDLDRGYRCYKKIDNGGYNLLFNWIIDLPQGNGVTLLYSDYDVKIGNTYSYYIVVYGNNWETPQSDIIELTLNSNSFLPPISLISPQDNTDVEDPNFVLKWDPVGVDLPYGNISYVITTLQISDAENLQVIWREKFYDMITAQITYNGPSLINNNRYEWFVVTRGYDVNGNWITSSGAEVWEFTYTANDINPPTVSNRSAINITQTSATIRGRIDDNGGEDADMYRWSYREKGGDTYNIPSDIGNYPVGDYALNMNDYLSPGRTYEFTFNARNSAGWSNNVSWEEFDTLPSPKLLDFITVNPSNITITWPESLQGDFDYHVTAHYTDDTDTSISTINCDISSDNTDAAYVSGNRITANCKYASSAEITISYTEGSITRSATMDITVNQVAGSICAKIVDSSGNLLSGNDFGYVLSIKVSSSWTFIKEVGGQESRYVFVSLSAGTYKIDFYDYSTPLGTKENIYLSSSSDTEVATLVQ